MPVPFKGRFSWSKVAGEPSIKTTKFNNMVYGVPIDFYDEVKDRTELINAIQNYIRQCCDNDSKN